ncbi:hypothetical protein LPTSP4_12130 [Leptospira ryugenii]|uniref:Uncharacterized protein n=1 Tax=Leptospira ryugenii TaxID=1917863 RepID=A0A2P2DYJ5_9LEPT|nr:TRL-like family protein [Leptospira ryugenii]GBF49697.1 hypothetical protein LPTSP4_12130 [Leptospira ryugenii]
MGANDSTKKMGEACGYNVLGFYSFGDISTKKAMENGGIKKVSVVDRHTFAILTLFAKVCTEVSGE